MSAIQHATYQAGWSRVPAKRVMREVTHLSTDGSELLLSVSEYYGVAPRAEKVEPSEHLTRADSLEGYKKCQSGDLVMNIMLAWKRALGVTAYDGIVSPAYAVFRFREAALIPRFAHYLLRDDAYVSEFRRLSTGVVDSRLRLYPEVFLAMPLTLPPVAEQERIANFLDEQTARIDALIAAKERLLELLAEHRLSVCERVVDEADHRGRAKLGFHVDLLPGFAFASDEFSRNPDDVPLLRGINVSPGTIRWDEAVYWPRDYDPALQRFYLRADDVVFGMDRPWISSGARVAMVRPEDEGALLLQRVCRLRGGSKLRQRFIYYALASDMFRQSIEVDLTGVSVPHISPEQILRFKVPVLSLEEQDARCAKADIEDERIRELEGQTKELLERLGEYRSSLISAAVTGQLDMGAFAEPARLAA